MRQGENDLNDTFKLRWENVYETMEMSGGENILRSDQLVSVPGDLASSKENQVQVDNMKEICFLLSADQKRYSFMLKQLMERDNAGRDEYPVMTTLSLDL